MKDFCWGLLEVAIGVFVTMPIVIALHYLLAWLGVK